MLTLICLLALSPDATAGELVVLVGEPVLVVVDGQTVPLTPGTSQARATGLAGGAHLVEVLDRGNRPMAELTVPVGVQEEVRLRFSRGLLSELGRGPMAASSTQGVAAGAGGTTPAGGVALSLAVTEGSGAPNAPVEGGFSMSVDLGSMGGPAFVDDSEPLPQAMAPADFARLLASVEAEAFSDQQVAIIRTAARNNYLSCAQLRQLLEPISFSNDKVEAMRAARGAVVDPQNAHELEAAFTFSSDKQKVRELFR